MSQPPTPYSRQYNFSGWSVSNPTTPHQGNKLDQEYNALLATVNATISRLSEIQKDDGTLRTTAASSAAKAWVTFNGTGAQATILASFNVASVYRTTTGVYLITFTAPLASVNYCWNASARGPSTLPVYACQNVNGQDVNGAAQTINQMYVVTADSAGNVNCPLVNVVIYG
jgi:hypothetical protein